MTPQTKRPLAISLASLFLLNGCRLSYRLEGQGPAAVLIPPVSRVASMVKVSNARRNPAALDGCDFENDLLGLEWRGNTAEIRLHSEAYFPAPGDERPEETAPRVYLDSVKRIEAFRDALKARVLKGCLRANEAEALTRAIVERLPFPPLIGHFIRFGGEVDGIVDLTADFRLKVVSPVRDAANEVVDYQIAWYRLEPSPGDARVRISPAAPPLAFARSFQYFLLLFRSASSPTNHLATILSSNDQSALDHATSRFKIEPDLSCATLATPNVTCLTPPPDVSINVEFPVSVNGKQVFVPLSGTLSDAMQPRTRGEGVPVTLRIRRLFRGHLRKVKIDPASQNILRFLLMPGDQINW